MEERKGEVGRKEEEEGMHKLKEGIYSNHEEV